MMAMAIRLLAGTRKGLFVFDVEGKRASTTATHFLGEPVTAVLPLNEQTWCVAMGHGHFGAKLHYTDDAGASWRGGAAPAGPPGPGGGGGRGPGRRRPSPG